MITITLPEYIQLRIGDTVIPLTKEDAIHIAVKLIRASCGDLISGVDNGKVIEWNLRSKFFQAYREDFEIL